jgi:hypothetical protein
MRARNKNEKKPKSAEGAAPESREAVAIDPGLRSSKRHA